MSSDEVAFDSSALLITEMAARLARSSSTWPTFLRAYQKVWGVWRSVKMCRLLITEMAALCALQLNLAHVSANAAESVRKYGKCGNV